MNALLSENPLLLLFLVAAIGYFVGSIKIKGASLGVAAVLFVGLAFGMSNPDFDVPDIIFQLGIVFFVYSIGLSSGPSFFQSIEKNGFRDIGFILLMLFISAIFAAIIHYLFGFSKGTSTGIYAGSSTNTTALASITETISKSNFNGKKKAIEDLAIGYTYSYPMGVLGVMMVLKFMEKWFKVDYAAEKNLLKKSYPVEEELDSVAVRITNPELNRVQLRDAVREQDFDLVFGRILKQAGVSLAHWDTILENGDLLMIIGSKSDLEIAIPYFGDQVEEELIHDKHDYEVRRIFISNPEVVGRELASLNLGEKFNAVVTRIRRGDSDMLAKADTILEMGDRIRFIARKSDMKALSSYFGDSYHLSSTVNIFSFGLGIALGLLVGTIDIPLTEQITFNLGYAGGPLIVGLIFGALRRTGPIVWTLPFSANTTLRQIGLFMLLATIGLEAGHSFLQSLGNIEGLSIFIGGTLLSMFTAFISVWIGYKIFKIPFSILLGFMSNQPAILDFANSMTKNKVPTIGYSVMFPISLIMKILFAQILYLILS